MTESVVLPHKREKKALWDRRENQRHNRILDGEYGANRLYFPAGAFSSFPENEPTGRDMVYIGRQDPIHAPENNHRDG